ncbi:MAG TPA: tRNA (adenosine(37)-N6)-threonylcarbamoyltransferase complex dimerization subunit type 1 TsaB [Pyrinomonadaceae bacterium]|jgi:tRNA threonylcarbamoyladenosine biosynthesis protein TsaB|nr:tRNA (adenosine(37)-N6)-threonylcarbamoyltransferase complex dimerization subunit type 1 TsaB [Pyrinomonadaceae bacterium]
MLTLSVETATERRSVAVLRAGHVLSLCERELRDGGGAAVLADIDRALAEASVRVADVELFAAASGPGSFTGLRAGLATVKALAATLGKPVVGVPTLHALAHATRPARKLCALLPAGRGEVFAQMLRVTHEGLVEELSAPEHVQPARLLERMSEGCVKFAGGGAHKFEGLLRERAAVLGLDFRELTSTDEEPQEREWALAPAVESLASDVGALALSRYEAGERGGADELCAIYVRPSDAELNEPRS